MAPFCDAMCARPVAANAITIADAGAVPPLIALLASPSIGVQQQAAGALKHLAENGTCLRLLRALNA